MPAKPKARPRRRSVARRLVRYGAIVAGSFVVLLTAVYVAARVYLPDLVERKTEIEARLSALAGQPVRLEHLEPHWDGLRPGVRVRGATVYAKDGVQPSVRIAEIQISIAALPLLLGRIEAHQLVLVRPELAAERLADGGLRIRGLEQRDRADPGAGLGWLVTQGRIVVHDGELHWFDARDPGGELRLAGIELTLRNRDDRHRFTVSARWPETMCRECTLSADIRGMPGENAWGGEVTARVTGLVLQELPLILRERLPEGTRGRIDADLWSDWRDGRPHLVRGAVSVDEVRLRWSPQRPALEARRIAGDTVWQRLADGWRLEVSQLALGLTRSPWRAGSLKLRRAAQSTSMELQYLDLDDVTAFVRRHAEAHPWLARWAEIAPGGAIRNLRIALRGDLPALDDYSVAGELVRVGTAVHPKLPSATGVSGHIVAGPDGGAFDLDARDFTFHLPTVFREPLAGTRGGGHIEWRKGESAWLISGANLYVHSPDGKGAATLKLEVPFDRKRSPELSLYVDFRDGRGANAARYYPAHKLPPRALAWMESAFVDGKIVAGDLIYDGPIREFPFADGQGRFELRAHVRDGVYRYLPGWTALTQVEADVSIDGPNALITGRGRIGSLQAYGVRVEVVRDPESGKSTVNVTGQVDGPVAETVRVLRAVESDKAFWREPLRAVAEAAGSGALDLEVHVPLKSAEPAEFLATYRFQDAALRLANGNGLEAGTGVVRFGRDGLHSAVVRGRLFGGPVAIAAATQEGALHLQGDGTIRLASLLRGTGAIGERISGTSDWSFTWDARSEAPRLRFEADLREVRTRLPAPLAKPDAGGPQRFVVESETVSADRLVLALEAAPALAGRLAFDRDGVKWSLDRGRIDIGRPPGALPEVPGVALNASLDALDIDQWLPLLGEGNRPVAAFAGVNSVSADIERFGLLNRDWGRSLIHIVRHRDGWRAVLDGDAAAGEASFLPGKSPKIRLDLAYLRLPPRRDVQAPGQKPADPRRLPSIELRARTFEYKQRSLGQFAFDAVSYAQGWRIERLELLRPETRLTVNGTWRRLGARETSEFDIDLASDDFGATLDAWGAEGQMAGGRTQVRAHLAWPNAPTAPALAALDGKVEMSIEKGRFLRFDPGAARLFGLLDLRSIGRYLTLDFSSAFGKGYAFDAIHGVVTIEHGNASTSGLVASGPALNLNVAGRVGLATEDYDLLIEASPRVGDTLTFTTWGLFGPQAAAAVLALRKLFSRQLRESTRVTYVVKGPWDNPTITKLAKPAEPPPPGATQPP